MNGARRAALLLAALTDQDSHDVLQRLPPAWRRQIAACLDELRALGAAPGYDWLDVLEGQVTPVAARQAAPDVATLAAADPQLIARLLAREPAPVVGALLAAHAWPWREAFLAACSGGRRTSVDNAMQRASGVSAAVLDVLIEHLARRVREAVSESGSGASFDTLLDRHEASAPAAKATGWRAAWAR